MLVALSVSSDMVRAMARLDAASRGQIPYAGSLAVNALARQAIADLKAEMQRVFDRPTPWTLNAFYWTKATKREPTAEIRARDFAGKGTPAWKYLTPEAFGGERRMKRFERALEAKLGSGFAVPGRGAVLNQYGNIGQGEIVRLLSALGAFAETGYIANRRARGAGRGRRQGTYFVAHARDGGEILGIYKVVSSGHVEPVLIFPRRAPSYRKRFPYRETAEASFAKHHEQAFAAALQTALETAR